MSEIGQNEEVHFDQWKPYLLNCNQSENTSVWKDGHKSYISHAWLCAIQFQEKMLLFMVSQN